MVVDLIETERIEDRLDALWDIGAVSGGGVTRLAYTEEETEAIEYVRSEIPAGFEVRTDSVGNVFATPYPDAGNSLYLGSHLDSVFNGGRLDGTLGVVLALEAIQAIHGSDVEPAIPPTLAIFRAEESARFGQHTIGSRAALGLLTVDDFAATDQSNIPLWQAMQQNGYQPENLSEPTLDLDSVAGFLETHIEQGRVLDEGGQNVGIVTGIRGPVRHRVTVRGNDDHSGATPMHLRRDALAGAAEMIAAIEEIGRETGDDGDLVASVGDITVPGGAINKVAGEASFPVDVRSNDRKYRDEVESRIADGLASIAERRNLTCECEELDRTAPVDLDGSMIERLEDAAAAVEADYELLPSGGGHDAMSFQRAGVPTGMLFTPSVDGVSHNPNEETTPAGIREATEIFVRAILDYDR